MEILIEKCRLQTLKLASIFYLDENRNTKAYEKNKEDEDQDVEMTLNEFRDNV